MEDRFLFFSLKQIFIFYFFIFIILVFFIFIILFSLQFSLNRLTKNSLDSTFSGTFLIYQQEKLARTSRDGRPN